MKISFLYIFLTVYGFAQSQTYTLTLNITDIKNIDRSTVRVAVYNSEESFMDEDQLFASAVLPADSSTIVCLFEEFPKGDYAITIFHDEDNDEEMDRKWYGPPKEGYAFSNNFTSNIRPAKFSDAVFELDQNKVLTIQMVY